MATKLRAHARGARRARLPLALQRRSTDEYTPLPHHPANLAVVERVRDRGPLAAARLSMSLRDYWSGRQGTAAALHELNEAWGGGFYNVPSEAALDRAAADEALGGDQLVIDVQTHWIAPRQVQPGSTGNPDILLGLGESVGGDRFRGLDKLVRTQKEAGYSLAEYLRCVFLESETAMAVLSSAPGAEGKDQKRMLTNSEMVGTRELVDRFAGSGRLINHSVVHPNIPGEIDMMGKWKDWCNPAGWKVYTLYGAQAKGMMNWSDKAWMLDDAESGRPFLQRAGETGVRIICAHKGLSGGSDTGWDGPSSPKDVGPAAREFPDISFLVYHSGYETREGDDEEGPYSEEAAHAGTNRLIKSLRDAGIGPGGNVYAELGTTWYLIMAHPREVSTTLEN